jgi:hypothetical protein
MFMMVFNGLAWLLIIGIAVLTLMVIFATAGAIIGKILAATRNVWPVNRSPSK